MRDLLGSNVSFRLTVRNFSRIRRKIVAKGLEDRMQSCFRVNVNDDARNQVVTQQTHASNESLGTGVSIAGSNQAGARGKKSIARGSIPAVA